jgi:hypothetical protein
VVLACRTSQDLAGLGYLEALCIGFVGLDTHKRDEKWPFSGFLHITYLEAFVKPYFLVPLSMMMVMPFGDFTGGVATV